MDIFGWIWLGWLAIFGVVEGIALANGKRGDTLSEKVWAIIFRDDEKRKPRGMLWFLLAGFLAWLAGHFLTGGVV